MTNKNSFLLTLKKVIYIFSSILTSKNKTAYFVLWLKFQQLLFLPIDVVLSKFDKKHNAKPKYPMVMVVGIHRTGSTFVSQVLGDFLPFYPLGNFSSIFPKSSYVIHRLTRKLFLKWRKKNKGKYKSYYGISYGKYTIGDCYEVWDQWFGKDHYCFDKEKLKDKEPEMQQYFANLEAAYQMPILSKNNRNYLAIYELQKIFPNTLFVITERNGTDTVKSTLQASNDYFGNDYLWGIRTNYDFDLKEYQSIEESACYQYLDLTNHLNEQLKKMDSKTYIRIPYESFCENPTPFLKEITCRLKNDFNLSEQYLPEITSFNLPKIRSSKRLKSNKELSILFEKIEKQNV